MKYLSVLLLVIVMAWSWALSQTERTFSLEMHKTLEAEMQQIIVAYIKEKQPDVNEITFAQLYTEVIRPEQEMKVHFRYTIDAPSVSGDTTEQVFTGHVLLKSDDGQSWTREGGELAASLLRFRNGIRVSPGTDTEPETEEAAQTGTEPAADDGSGH